MPYDDTDRWEYIPRQEEPPTPTQDDRYEYLSRQDSGGLASSRADIMSELDQDPATKRLTMQMLDTEGGGVATLEALVNRTNMIRQKIPGWTLNDELNSGFYGPINRGYAQNLDLHPASVERYQRDIDEVRAGSNIIQGRTDQGSGNDPNVGGPGRVHVASNPKEVYNYWTGNRMGMDFSHEDSARFAGALSIADQKLADAQANPPSMPGDSRYEYLPRQESSAQPAAQQPEYTAGPRPDGMVNEGNLNIHDRPIVHNPDGSISTDVTISIGVGGKEVLIPTVINGKIVSSEEAIQHFKKTGENFGSFKDVASADAYSQTLHNRPDPRYKSGTAPQGGPRDVLISAIDKAEKDGYAVPHFIGTKNEPEGDRAPTMDMENLVVALGKQEQDATKAGDVAKANMARDERSYWENEIKTKGMSAEQWRNQTGEPDPRYKSGFDPLGGNKTPLTGKPFEYSDRANPVLPKVSSIEADRLGLDRWKDPTSGLEVRKAFTDDELQATEDAKRDKEIAAAKEDATRKFGPDFKNPSPFIEWPARVARGAELGLHKADAAAYDVAAKKTEQYRNPYMDKGPEQAKKDLPMLFSRVVDLQNKIAMDFRGNTPFNRDSPEMADYSKRMAELAQANNQLDLAKKASQGKIEEGIGGKISREAEKLATATREQNKKAAEKYEPFISEAHKSQWGMQLAESIGNSLPGTGAAIVNPLFGLSVMYAQTYDQAREEYAGSMIAQGKPVNPEEQHLYASKQAGAQTPMELAGDLPFAAGIKGILKSVPRAAIEGGAETFGKWLAGAVKKLVPGIAGETLVTTPGQTVAQDVVAEEAGVQKPTTWGEKLAKIPPQMGMALTQSLIMGGAPVMGVGGIKGFKGDFRGAAAQAPEAPAGSPAFTMGPEPTTGTPPAEPAQQAAAPTGDERFAPGAVPTSPLGQQTEAATPLGAVASPTAVKGVEMAKSKAKETLNFIQAPPKWDHFMKTILNWSATSARDKANTRKTQELMEKSMTPRLREAITNWIEAGGDTAELQRRASLTNKANLKQGYVDAAKLTPEEQAAAESIQKQYEELRQSALDNGIDIKQLENYVTHLWQNPELAGTGNVRGLSEYFRFAKKRNYPNFFTGEQAGETPKTKDIAKLLPIYKNALDDAINAKNLVDQLEGGKASDGRPLVAPMKIMATDQGQGYRSLGNHPAFAGKVVHPEVYTHLNRVLGKSLIREWWNSPSSNPLTEMGKGITRFALDEVQQYMKGTRFSLSPFHQVHLGKHAISHLVNPLKHILTKGIDPNDHKTFYAMQHGLMVSPDNYSQSLFMEGVGAGQKNLLTVAMRKTGMEKGANLIDGYTNYLFHDFIPALKLDTFYKIMARNENRFAKELKSGEVTTDQIASLTADETNASYGHLNYTKMGRSPTVQHLLQIGLLAPDFFEARARYAFQGAKGLVGGKATEQLQSLVGLSVALYVLARAANQLDHGDPEWEPEDAFAFKHGNKSYSVRSVPGDIHDIIFKGIGRYISNRKSPLVGTAVQNLVTGENWRDEKTDLGKTITEMLAGTVPMPAQGWADKLFDPDRAQSISPFEKFMGSVGFQTHRFSPINTTYGMANDWKKANIPNYKEKDISGQSKYTALRNALDDGDKELAKEEAKKLGNPKAVAEGIRDSVLHPFTGSMSNDSRMYKSLDAHDKKVFDAAIKRRSLLLKRYNEYIGGVKGGFSEAEIMMNMREAEIKASLHK